MSQFLFIESLLKLALAIPLILVPLSTLKLLGLPHPPSGFWPRMTGGLLLGLAAAIYIETRLPGSNGLGLYGIIAINLIAAGTLMGLLIMNSGAPTRRGQVVLWLAMGLLLTLALAEISVV